MMAELDRLLEIRVRSWKRSLGLLQSYYRDLESPEVEEELRVSLERLRSGLELADPSGFTFWLPRSQLAGLLADVERRYLGLGVHPGPAPVALRRGLFDLRNVLALVERYGITGAE